MSLNCQVQVTLSNLTREKADTIRRALEPDNIDFPEGLSLNIENIDDKLVVNFQSQNNMKSLIGTVDEVLEHIQVALKVIEKC